MNFSKLFRYCPVCGSAHFIVNNEKSMRCVNCDFIYYVNPSAATASFIVNQARELLVCRRANDPARGTLDLPGGFVDADETGEQAITREIKEELGLNTLNIKYLFSLPNLYLYSGLTIPTLDMFFACTVDDSQPLVAADDVSECFYVPVQDLNPDDFGLQSIKKAVNIFMKTYNVK